MVIAALPLGISRLHLAAFHSCEWPSRSHELGVARFDYLRQHGPAVTVTQWVSSRPSCNPTRAVSISTKCVTIFWLNPLRYHISFRDALVVTGQSRKWRNDFESLVRSADEIERVPPGRAAEQSDWMDSGAVGGVRQLPTAGNPLSSGGREQYTLSAPTSDPADPLTK